MIGWRPERAGVQWEELEKQVGMWQEQHLVQAPHRASGLPQELLYTPQQGDVDRCADVNSALQGASPRGCRRQRPGL